MQLSGAGGGALATLMISLSEQRIKEGCHLYCTVFPPWTVRIHEVRSLQDIQCPPNLMTKPPAQLVKQCSTFL